MSCKKKRVAATTVALIYINSVTQTSLSLINTLVYWLFIHKPLEEEPQRKHSVLVWMPINGHKDSFWWNRTVVLVEGWAFCVQVWEGWSIIIGGFSFFSRVSQKPSRREPGSSRAIWQCRQWPTLLHKPARHTHFGNCLVCTMRTRSERRLQI